MKALVTFSLPVLLATMLAGCGAGGEDDAAVAATTTGMFRDAPVSGLWYQSTTGNAYTSSTGTFPYKPGVTYTFYVGAVKLGSFIPTVDNATVTPANLVPEGTANRETVILNLTRFLMTLDQSAIEGGIQISSTMDSKALKWPPIDFSSTTVFSSSYAIAALFGATGTGAFDGINAVNGATAYVSESDARSHLSTSMSCAYSGAFVATRMNGSVVDSRVALLVRADDDESLVSAFQYFPGDAASFSFSAPAALVYTDLLPTGSLSRDVASVSNSSVMLRYKHSASDVDHVFINTTRTGSLSSDYQTVDRLAGTPTAIRRFAGLVTVTGTAATDYVYAVEIDSAKVVTGKVQDLRTGASATLTGSYDSGTGIVSATASIGSRTITLSGSLNASTQVWSGSLADTGAASPVSFTSAGCKLNLS
jgi:hypothetical protein